MVGLVRLRRGDRFAEDFEILRVVAEGGMGTVYAVHDHAAGEVRAIKLLLPELIADERSRRRFTQEAQVAAAIESPHVPQVYRGGIDPVTATPYILMELLDGEDLRERIGRQGALPVLEALPIFDQLGHALEAAHRAGIVHRDLKPRNVFLQMDSEGGVFVKLLDFGVAKLLDAHRTSATGTGAVGSPMWMAPEQTSAGGRIAPATDVWAFGLLVFYVLTGKVFWETASGHQGVTGLLREIHVDPIPVASGRARQLGATVTLPDGFDAWFERAVCRDPRVRYRDAGVALLALRPVLRTSAAHSQLAYASTLAFAAPKVEIATGKPPDIPLTFDSAATLPFSGVRTPEERTSPVPEARPPADSNDPTPVHAPPPRPSDPSVPATWTAEDSRPYSIASRPEFTRPARTSTEPAEPEGRGPWMWAGVLLFATIAVCLVASLAVWVVLNVGTP